MAAALATQRRSLGLIQVLVLLAVPRIRNMLNQLTAAFLERLTNQQLINRITHDTSWQ